MAFPSTTTSAEVVAAFASQVAGRTFVITGAGHPSIGSSIAFELAKASPKQIIIASRTSANVDPVLSAIHDINPAVKAAFIHLDLSDHKSVRQAATEILTKTDTIDVLINSAGNMAIQEYTTDQQGIEMQLSVNHIGHFLLTNLLISGLLVDNAQPITTRVVNITSAGYQISPVRFEDSGFTAGKQYDPWSGYGQAKTAQILFSYGLTKRLKLRGVTSFACHPGSNLDTKLGSHLAMEAYNDIMPITKRNTGMDFVFSVGDEPRFKTYEQIGATPLVAALDPALANSDVVYLQNNHLVQPVAEHAYDEQHVEKCWKLSEKLVGQKFEY